MIDHFFTLMSEQKKISRFAFMLEMYRKNFPLVRRQLKHWKKNAQKIPSSDLKHQALSSIISKFFHCEGAAVFAVLCRKKRLEFLRFAVAFQTISDYLDNLCDRGDDISERHFRQLHLAMVDALTPNGQQRNYYLYGKYQNDGGYLCMLVAVCQESLVECKGYAKIQSYLFQLCRLYTDLQVYKHLQLNIRAKKLWQWVDKENDFALLQNVFAAATGSTLGIFMLVAYMMEDKLSEKAVSALYELYFPYVQGFHILLDYFIDQQEDLAGGDLNFCRFFANDGAFYDALYHLYWKASQLAEQVSDGAFHVMLMHAMLGLYLADPKVRSINFSDELLKKILEIGRRESQFFYQNAKIYHWLQSHLPG